MNQLLMIGATVQAQGTGLPCQVDEFLGGGAQGEVYRASYAGQAVALKWYFPQYRKQDPDLRRRLQQIIRFGAPSERFLWPIDIVVQPQDDTGFGYIMALREPRFKGLGDLVTRRVTPSFRALVTTGFELALNYRNLHQKGLCYRDIAFGNLFFDPATGEVRISDNDNVDVNNRPGVINGTPRFMAPEIVRGEAAPSTQTDLFSLSVLLFYLLCNHHPLEGARELAIRCFDQPAMTRLYGSEPLFIFDPHDDSNRPVAGEQDNPLIFWPLYPQTLHNLFTRAFTHGLRDAEQGRVRESEWCSALVAMRDAIHYCPQCGAENFYDPAHLRSGHQPGCWACNQTLQLPPRLRIQHRSERMVILLNHDAQLYPHHLNPTLSFDFGEPVAAVVRHPTDPARWGLENRGAEPWVVATAAGGLHDVPPGRRVALASGTRIHFGPSEGEIRVGL
jgi:DNA-binding helix-hairpin-helix protein with protein kinase domain